MTEASRSPAGSEPSRDEPERSAREDPITDPRLLVGWLQRVRRRFVADRFIRAASLDLGVSLGLLVALLVLDRALFPGVVTGRLCLTVLCVSLAVSLLRTLLSTPLDLFTMAVLADSRLELKERVSSALFLLLHGRPIPSEDRSAPSDPERGEAAEEWERLVSRDAGVALRGVSIPDGFPLRVPRSAGWNLVPLAGCLAVALWLPSFDLLGKDARRLGLARLEQAVEERTKELEEKIAEAEKEAELQGAKRARDVLKLLRQATPEREERSRAEEGVGRGDPKKTALLEMARREDVLRKGMAGTQFEALGEAMRAFQDSDLKGADVTRRLREALKDGDLRRAEAALEELREELAALSRKADGERTTEEKARVEKLSAELQALAKQLARQGERGSSPLSSLAKALSDAGSRLDAARLREALESLSAADDELASLSRLSDELELLDRVLQQVQVSKDQLAGLRQCSQCGAPFCPDCGKPTCGCKPGAKPGGT